MKSLMKVLVVKTILFLMTTSAAAQTTTTVQYPLLVGIKINAPCANFGKGQSMNLTANWEAMNHIVLANGKQSGFFLYAGKTLKGTGLTNGHWYYADGTIRVLFTNRNPMSIDGSYDVTTDLQIVSSVGTKDTERFIYHLRQRFTYFNSGENYTFDAPDELLCQ